MHGSISHRLTLVLCLLAIVAMALTGCQPPAAPQPTVAPTTAPTAEPTSAPAEAAASFQLTVAGQAFDAAALRELEITRTVQTPQGEEATYTGIALRPLLDKVGLTSGALSLVASDGYAAEVAVAEVSDDCLLAYNDEGGLNAVMPGLGKGVWVKDVVELAAAATEAEGDAVITLNGQPLTQADLEALEPVSQEVDGTTYQGVRLLDLLRTAGVTSGEITMTAGDGYAASVELSALTPECLLAFADDGTLDAVMPGLSKGSWVKGVVEIAATAREAEGEAVITVLDTPFTMADLEALEQATVTVDGEERSGVSLLALLKAAGVVEGDVALVAGDGYAANVTLADITDECLLAYAEGGALDAVMPGMSKAAWVRGVVEIREGKPTSGSEANTDPAAEDDEAPLGGPLSLVDAAGRTVEFENLPRRILVVGRGPHMSLHLLYMFPEGRERLVGTESRGATASNFLPVVDPRFDDVPTLDANPNVEQIAAMSPDLVIMKGLVEDETAQALAQVDIPVMYVGLETVDQFFVDLANLGEVLGNTERADEIAAFYQTRLDRLAERTAEIAEEDKPRVLLLEYEERSGEVAVKVPAAAWMQTLQVETAGGHPVWLDSAAPTDGWTVANLEQIAQWDADMVFVVVWYTFDPQEVIDGFKADPQWSELRAVKDNAIHAFPQDIFGWDQPEPRWILGMNWLATHIHPELFDDVDMNAEVMAFFSELYGMDEAAIERDILPTVRMDVR